MTPTSLSPTATGSPTRLRRPASSEEEAEFTPVPGLAVPAPVDPLPIPESVDVLVLLGSDRTAPILGRTDTIILVFYQRQEGVTSLVSVPRDLLVYLPGKEMNRINTAYFFGGIDLLISTLEYNLGVRPHHWALAHLDDFSRFIDDLGGLDLSVSHPLLNDCGGIPTGDVHMDGAMALCYLRERRTSNDFIRSQRQLQALRAILDRLLTLDALSHLPEWHARYRDSVSTDLSLEDMLALAPLALKMGSATTHHYQISYDQVNPWRVPETGAQVMLPDRQAIRALLQEAISVLAPVEAGTTTPAPNPGTPGPDT
jgi:LCP family protein required for cell wall assembly